MEANISPEEGIARKVLVTMTATDNSVKRRLTGFEQIY
jgi:hypothetical protein